MNARRNVTSNTPLSRIENDQLLHGLHRKQQSEGRVDCVVETPNYIYIFEFKRDGSAEEALKQIEDMGYAREYAADGRKIYQIGCNFSSKTGTIDGWK